MTIASPPERVPEPPAPVPRRLYWLPVLVVALVLGWGTAGAFVWDDDLLVVHNPLLAPPWDLGALLGGDLWAQVPSDTPTSGYYRPLLVLDLVLDRLLVGLSPLGHRLHSLLWHLAAVLLLDRLLRRFGAEPVARTVGLAVFALHPAQVEAVLFVSARNDPMATVWLLAALLLLGGERCRPVAGALAVLAATLSKEIGFLAPLLLLVVTLARGGRWSRGQWAAWIGVALGVGARLLAGVGWPERADAGHLLSAAPRAFAFLAQGLLWPVDRAPGIHLAWLPPVPWGWAVVGAGLVLVGLWIRDRGIRAGVILAVLALAPAVVGTAQHGMVADRYLCLPLVGVAVAMASVWRRFGGESRRGAAMATLSTLGLGALVAVHVPRWRDDVHLWRAAVARWDNAYVHGALARALHDEGDRVAASVHYRAATAAPRPFPHACYNIVPVQLERGAPGAAVADAERALENGCAPSPELVAPYAVALAMTGRWAEAREWAEGLARDPTGLAVVVRAAAALRVGDTGVLAEIIEERGGDRKGLLDRAEWLLVEAGEGARMWEGG